MRALFTIVVLSLFFSCMQDGEKADEDQTPVKKEMSAADILGNADYPAISYGGYREKTRDIQPTVEQLKQDMQILSAAGIRVLRTYNVELKHASNVLEAIHQLKQGDPEFEMYVMLGAWIDCLNARTPEVNHDAEDTEANEAEIERAIELTNRYPDIVKIIAVGNEAMVKWQANYFVQADVILKYVQYLQAKKQAGELPADLWITSSDNFASWGGGGAEYHTPDLEALINAVDFVSMHTYPMHDTHYNPDFWGVLESETDLPKLQQIDSAMVRARDYAIHQYRSVAAFIDSLGIEKPIHIGETGWASASNGFYGPEGSKATDEYKEAIYYRQIRDWTNEKGISCFYFQAFDEPWKDAQNPGGSENHFGLFTVDGQAKYALWDLVDRGVFEGLTRDGKTIGKTYSGDREALLEEVLVPPVKKELKIAH